MWNRCKRAGGCGGLDVWGNYKLGSDAIGCLAVALLWNFSDF